MASDGTWWEQGASGGAGLLAGGGPGPGRDVGNSGVILGRGEREGIGCSDMRGMGGGDPGAMAVTEILLLISMIDMGKEGWGHREMSD